jgi:hypothetical protein
LAIPGYILGINRSPTLEIPMKMPVAVRDRR